MALEQPSDQGSTVATDGPPSRCAAFPGEEVFTGRDVACWLLDPLLGREVSILALKRRLEHLFPNDLEAILGLVFVHDDYWTELCELAEAYESNAENNTWTVNSIAVQERDFIDPAGARALHSIYLGADLYWFLEP